MGYRSMELQQQSVPMQTLDDPHATHDDQYQRDAWLQLQSSLARTLDDLYLVCEGDSQSELVLSTLRILEETVDDFRLLAGSNTPNSSTTSDSSSAPQAACTFCPEQRGFAASAAADAAAVISKSSSLCSWGCSGSSTWCTGAAGLGSLCKPPGSRLSRSSSTGNAVCLEPTGCPWREACGTGSCEFCTCSQGSCSQVAGSAAAVAESNPLGVGDDGQSHNSATGADIGSAVAPQALHDKLSSPDRLRRSPSQTKAASEERHARAERLRERLAEARLARLQEQLAKQQQRAAANKAQEPGSSASSSSSSPAAAKAADKHHRSSLLRAAHLRRIRAKAEDESRKVDEVSFINSLTTAGRRADLQQRLEEGEARRAEALAAILARQQEAAANIREAAERRRQAEAERLAQLEHRQRRKQEVQDKMEQERRAAVAAREAARAHARAVAQQREVVRQQQASLLREQVTARLKQAAERRLQHLELIRERAALGKDFDRRDSFAGVSGSGRQSPVGASVGRQATRRSPACECPASDSSSDSSSGESSDSRTARTGVAASLTAESSTASVQPSMAASAVLLPCDVFSQLQGHSQSIAAAGLSAAPSSVKSSMKGARRRMAKARHRMQQPGCCFQEPEQAQLLCQSPEGQQLLAAWAPHLAVLGVQHLAVPLTSSPHSAAAGADITAATAAADAASGATGPVPAPAAHVLVEQVCACDSSSKSSSATNSPRSSMSSYAGASVSTSTFSSTVVGSPAVCCPAGWGLSRSSSCCDCDSQHSAHGALAAVAACTRSKAAGEEQQREALAAIVTSARAHLPKQQVLVSHLARRSGLLHRLCEELLAGSTSSSGAAGCGGSGPSLDARVRKDRLQQARLLELLGRLLELPVNLDYLLSCRQMLPAFVSATRVALDHCNSLDEPSMMAGSAAASRVSTLLQVLVAVLEHTPSNTELVSVQEQLVGFTVAAGIMARLASVFSLFDQPMQEVARPVPPHVLQCLRLLGGLTAVRCPPDELLPGSVWPCVAPNAAAIVLEMQATSMAGVLSLLTAVLLNASPTCTPAEASSRALPPNFVEAAHLVMAVLNNVCRLDLMAGQYMLSCAHHRMEFYHLISFLLSYCLSRWPAPLAPAPPAAAGPGAGAAAVAQPCPVTQQQLLQQHQQQQHVRGAECADAGRYHSSSSSSHIGTGGCNPLGNETGRPPGAAVLHHPIAQLLNQVLLLIGLFCVQHPSNQAMLTWGRSPSILQRLCSLPQEYLQVPELRAVLMPTLLCVCFGAERSYEIVAQHFDLGSLLQYVVQQQHREHRQQGLPVGQHTAGQTRQERRRQRRAQQRQEQGQQHVQPPGAPSCHQQDLEQYLPAQAQQLLQQVNTCCCGTAPSSSGGDSSNSSSVAARKSIQPGRSRHIMFACCRRFPMQLLASAAEQLGQALLVMQQRGPACCHHIGVQPAVTAEAGAALHLLPLGSAVAQQGQKPQDAELQQPAAATQDAVPVAAEQNTGTETVVLPLQLQRASAAKLVRCKVVACS